MLRLTNKGQGRWLRAWREEIIRDNTRKMYMAVNRAGQRLVFTYVGDLPEMLKQVFTLQHGTVH